MPFFSHSNGMDVNGGQMNEVAGDFYGRVGHKGDQYFGTGNTGARRRPGGSVSVGVNSGSVNVKINLGLLDMGTNTPNGSLEVVYNGPKLRTCNVRTLGTPQKRRSKYIVPRKRQKIRDLESGHQLGADHIVANQDTQPSQQDRPSALALLTANKKEVTATQDFGGRGAASQGISIIILFIIVIVVWVLMHLLSLSNPNFIRITSWHPT